MNWDRWTPHDKPVEQAYLVAKYILAIPVPWRVNGEWVRRTVRVTLVCVRATDQVFHTHPAAVVRIILRNGYVEHIRHPDGSVTVRRLKPGMFNLMKTSFVHKIAELPNGPSWSLWLRGVPTADTRYFYEREKVTKVASHPRRARTY